MTSRLAQDGKDAGAEGLFGLVELPEHAFDLREVGVPYRILEMDPALVHYLDCVRQPYNVSSVAQAAALA
ncbi:MAG: histidinol-phosphate aminotransferase, partial [Euryarchaeota archaeon]|nr:histidinol-phosphate aminotransferase [Euryarchaeota archaeon]